MCPSNVPEPCWPHPLSNLQSPEIAESRCGGEQWREYSRAWGSTSRWPRYQRSRDSGIPCFNWMWGDKGDKEGMISNATRAEGGFYVRFSGDQEIYHPFRSASHKLSFLVLTKLRTRIQQSCLNLLRFTAFYWLKVPTTPNHLQSNRFHRPLTLYRRTPVQTDGWPRVACSIRYLSRSLDLIPLLSRSVFPSVIPAADIPSQTGYRLRKLNIFDIRHNEMLILSVYRTATKSIVNQRFLIVCD